MSFIHAPLKWLMKYRLAEIERLKNDPISAQEKTLFEILFRAENTEYGKKYNFESIKNISDFQKNVPINSYEDFFPFIERMMKGQGNILWPGIISWFSKSSGTTNARSKFIPVSNESLEECHFEAGKDELGLYIKNNPNTKNTG